MSTFEIAVYSADGSERTTAPLKIQRAGDECRIRLKPIAGASAVHVAVLKDAQVVQCIEVPTGPSDNTISVLATWDGGDLLDISSPGRQVLTLPAELSREPDAPIRLAAASTAVDLAIVVDGTMRTFGDIRTSTPDRTEPWERFLDNVSGLVDLLGEERDLRTAVLAFGDHPMSTEVAADLRPDYALYPEEAARRHFEYLTPEATTERLRAIPRTSGGDFVDALGSALHACCELRWRPAATKLCLLWGDSPGQSTTVPPPLGADLRARKFDVDTESRKLHRHKVIIATVYEAPPAALGLEELGFKRKLLQFAQEQYERIASLPSLYFRSSDFDAAALVVSLQRRPGSELIARGPSIGQLAD